jgi:hypothetical protein
MSTSHPLAPFARRPSGGIFADVSHVDDCGAPILGEHARELGICENGMDPATLVAVYGVPGSAKTDGYLTQVQLRLALRDVERGLLRRVGAAAFEVVSLAPAIGPGLTHRQTVIRQNKLANA